MNRFSIQLLASFFLALVASCGSSGSHRKLDRPREEVAELRGIPSEFKLLGTTYRVGFTSLDGEAFQKSWAESLPDVIDVLPGKHQVGVYYSIKFDGQHGPSGDLEAEVDAVAGRAYQADLLHSDAKGWYVEFREPAPEPEKSGTTRATEES